MGDVSHVAAPAGPRGADRLSQGDEGDPRHEVLRTNGDRNGKQHDLPITIEHAKRHQNAQNSSRRAYRGSLRAHAPHTGVRNRDGG